MTADRLTRRARLDGLLDQGGLGHASPEDLAWLAAERAADADFDREVLAILRAEAHLRDWGRHASRIGEGPDEAIAAIFAGLDAGRFDDGFDVDAVPAFDDGDGSVVGLAAVTPRAPRAGGASHVGAAARGTKLWRDGRLMPLLAAAAAVVVVVSGGLTAVGTMSRESSPEAVAAAPLATAPAVSVTVPSAAPPEPMAPMPPSPQEAAEVRAVPMREGGLADHAAALPTPSAAPAPTVVRAPTDGVIGSSGHGGERVADEEFAGGSPSADRTRATSGAAHDTPDTNLSLAMAPPSSQAAPMPAPQQAAPAAELVEADGTRAETVRPGAAAPAGRIVRYASLLAMQRAMARCVRSARDLTYEVARDTGTVRVLTAPAASSVERRCLDEVAQQTSVVPAPGVARRQRITVTPVSDTRAQ